MHCKGIENGHVDILNYRLDYEIGEKAIESAILK